MSQRQQQIVGLERSGDDAADDNATIQELLREVLKELRQIRGILGHMASVTAGARPSGDDE
jgi:hypothetical protein